MDGGRWGRGGGGGWVGGCKLEGGRGQRGEGRKFTIRPSPLSTNLKHNEAQIARAELTYM